MEDFPVWGEEDTPPALFSVLLRMQGIEFPLSFRSAKVSPDEAIADVVDRFIASCLFDGEDDEEVRAKIRVIRVINLTPQEDDE